MVNNGIKHTNHTISHLQVEIEYRLDRYCFQKSQGPFTFWMYPKTLEIMGISSTKPTGSSQVFRATLASQVELVVGLIEVGASFFR